LCKHGRLPEFERFLAIEPVDKIVAPVYRSRDLLPKWFSIFEELRSNVRLVPQLRISHRSASARVNVSSTAVQVPKVPLDPKNADNTRTVRSILTESANVARAAMSSILPTDRHHLLSSNIPVTVSQDTGHAVSSAPSNDVTLQCTTSYDLYHPVDVAPASVAQGDILIITTDHLQQLGFDANILPVVTACNTSHPDVLLLHCDQSGISDNESVPLLSSVTVHDVPASDNMNQPATTVITTSPNLIGRAFASAVGISVDQLSSFVDVEPDNLQWTLPPATCSQVTTAAVSSPMEITCGISSNVTTVQLSEQAVTDSDPNVNVIASSTHTLICEDSSSMTGSQSKSIFAGCDVDMSALDITMWNSSLSPSLPSQPCDHNIDCDSTLATPKKMLCSRDGEMLTFAGSKIHGSDEARMSPSDTVLAVVTDSQYPVSYKNSEVPISGVSSALSGCLVPSLVTDAIGSCTVMSTVSGSNSFPSINSVPVPTPAHGMALLSSQMSTISCSSDIRPSAVISLTYSTPLPAVPHDMSLPVSSFHQTKQIPIHHMRSPSKRVLSNQRLILPQSEQPISSSKAVSFCLSKPKPKKSTAKVHVKALPAIAPKVVVAKSYLSPVKQAAASITARAKRLQSSPSRNVWYTAPRLKTAETSSCSVSPATMPALNPPDVWTLTNDDDDEAASGGEEQNTDVDSQLEDEFEEVASAPSAEQPPTVYVQSLASSITFHDMSY